MSVASVVSVSMSSRLIKWESRDDGVGKTLPKGEAGRSLTGSNCGELNPKAARRSAYPFGKHAYYWRKRWLVDTVRARLELYNLSRLRHSMQQQFAPGTRRSNSDP